MAQSFVYVPVQRWKGAEKTALSHIPQNLRELICPVVEVCPKRLSGDAQARLRERAEYVRGCADDVIDCCRGYQTFVDFGHVDRNWQNLSDNAGQHPLAMFFGRISERKLLFDDHAPVVVPVVGFGCSQRYFMALREVVKKCDRLCVRLVRADFQVSGVGKELSHLVESVGMEAPSVDLILDFGLLPRTARGFDFIEGNLPHLGQWRSLTVLAGTFPKDLQSYPLGKHYRSRDELHFWREYAWQSRDLGQAPAFGDYTIQHPLYEEPPEFCNPSASIRYATEDAWVIMRGEGIRNKNGPGSKQWAANAQVLMASKEYHGIGYSYGADYIAAVAAASEHPGSPESWLAATINHHIMVTTRRLEELVGGADSKTVPSERTIGG